MKLHIFTKTDLVIFFLYLAVSIIISLMVWFLPSDFSRSFLPIVPTILAVALFLIIRRHDRMVEQRARRADYRQMEAWIALQQFIKPQLPLSGLRGGALSPDMAEILCRELLTQKPDLVVECGAGVSTLIIGYILKGLGKGKLVTLEHDLEWQKRVNSWITLHDLRDHLVVLHAPLIEQQLERDTVFWYDISEFEKLMKTDLLPRNTIDLLFVDGPPEFVSPYVRRPAVFVMRQWFATNCVVVVDDANRPADADIIRQWCETLGPSCKCERFATEKGTAIIRIGS